MRSVSDSRGATAIEYALILGLVILGLIWFQGMFVQQVQNDYDSKKDSLNFLNNTPLFTPVP